MLPTCLLCGCCSNSRPSSSPQPQMRDVETGVWAVWSVSGHGAAVQAVLGAGNAMPGPPGPPIACNPVAHIHQLAPSTQQLCAYMRLGAGQPVHLVLHTGRAPPEAPWRLATCVADQPLFCGQEQWPTGLCNHGRHVYQPLPAAQHRDCCSGGVARLLHSRAVSPGRVAGGTRPPCPLCTAAG